MAEYTQLNRFSQGRI